MDKRVLLIEDEPNLIEAIRFILTRGGWAVQTHSDGATAVARIREARPDVLVLDVMLPGRSGLTFLMNSAPILISSRCRSWC
jgi:DNA-binding response OmpR family regulator